MAIRGFRSLGCTLLQSVLGNVHVKVSLAFRSLHPRCGNQLGCVYVACACLRSPGYANNNIVARSIRDIAWRLRRPSYNLREARFSSVAYAGAACAWGFAAAPFPGAACTRLATCLRSPELQELIGEATRLQGPSEAIRVALVPGKLPGWSCPWGQRCALSSLLNFSRKGLTALPINSSPESHWDSNVSSSGMPRPPCYLALFWWSLLQPAWNPGDSCGPNLRFPAAQRFPESKLCRC